MRMARIVDGEKMNLIGTSVKKIRRQKHMSQQYVSNQLELLGVYVCRGSMSRIEDLSRTVTDMELYALSVVLGVSIEQLFDRELIEKKYRQS